MPASRTKRRRVAGLLLDAGAPVRKTTDSQYVRAPVRYARSTEPLAGRKRSGLSLARGASQHRVSVTGTAQRSALALMLPMRYLWSN